MTQDAITRTEHDPPIFDQPIPADLPRRQMDRRLLESLDSEHRRDRETSHRLTRLEGLFEQIGHDIARLEQQQREGLRFHEQTASNMAEIANKLAVHTEMEDYQWQVVRQSTSHLEQLSASFNEYSSQVGGFSSRMDWLERTLFSLCGVLGALLMTYLTRQLTL